MTGTDKSKSPEMFNKIAKRYDLVNRVVSFGIDKRWRKYMVREVAKLPSASVLDLATGTGDVVVDLLSYGNVAQVTGVDPSEGMLAIARRKVPSSKVSFQIGDAQRLQFSDGYFDAVTIAFGIRNVPDFQTALREMYRVLRPGGMLFVLEFSMPKSRLVRMFYLLYLRHLLPNVGALLTGNKSAYTYLDKTIEAFPYGNDFANMLNQAGFPDVSFKTFTFGVATLYSAKKI